MAFKLDNDLLEELGLAALSPDEKQAMLRQILETLEMRVGTTLASKMTEAQLDEFERLMPAAGDTPEAVRQKEQQALQWLEANFPNYKQVVNDELEKLKTEIRQSASQIVAASQAGGGPTPVPPPPSSVPLEAPAAPPAYPAPADRPMAFPTQPAAQPQPLNPPSFSQQQPPPNAGYFGSDAGVPPQSSDQSVPPPDDQAASNSSQQPPFAP